MHFVGYCDGSSRPNPGFGGYGIFGYFYQTLPKGRNFKHPIHSNLIFTSKGIQSTKIDENIEVKEIVEVVYAFPEDYATNNKGELCSVVDVLSRYSKKEDLESILIITDSNYVVKAFNENMSDWASNNWRRKSDNKEISHRDEWEYLYFLYKGYQSKGVEVRLEWVKGHSDNYGNNLADTLSVIGSNAARYQITNDVHPFKDRVLDITTPFQDYKKILSDKDFVYFFKDLFFSSNAELDDSNFCFIMSNNDPQAGDTTIGKRDVSCIFALNVGYVPPLVNNFKRFYKGLSRSNDYTATCCMKLSKFKDKELLRYANIVEPEFVLVKSSDIYKNAYYLIGDTTPFLFETVIDYPFMPNAYRLFNKMLDMHTRVLSVDDKDELVRVFDVTPTFIKDGKLTLANNLKVIDLTDTVPDADIVQRLRLKVGYDIPSYLSLKNIEADIQKVELVIEGSEESSYLTVYIRIVTNDRNIYAVNMDNNYLKSHLKKRKTYQ